LLLAVVVAASEIGRAEVDKLRRAACDFDVVVFLVRTVAVAGELHFDDGPDIRSSAR
jgi:hypothetical protein